MHHQICSSQITFILNASARSANDLIGSCVIFRLCWFAVVAVTMLQLEVCMIGYGETAKI